MNIINECDFVKSDVDVTSENKQLIPVGYYNHKLRNYLVVQCTKCTDNKLYGSGYFYLNTRSFKLGCLPCGCSKAPAWNEDQYKVMLDSKLQDFNVEFKGWDGEYKGKSTKVKIYCNKHMKLTKSYSINNVLNSPVGGCKECSLEITNATTLLSIDDYKNRGVKSGTFYKEDTLLSKYRKDCTTYIEYNCKFCSNDIYVKYGLCSGIFRIRSSHIKDGNKPCRCSSQVNWTKEQRLFQINRKIYTSDLPHTFICFNNYKSSTNSDITVECKSHGLFKSTIDLYLSKDGTGCTSCTKHGFDSNRPASIYVVKWSDGDTTFGKVGITNKEVCERISQQKSKTVCNPVIIKEWYCESGKVIQSLEKDIKSVFNLSVVNKETLPDGYTETFNIRDLKDVISYIETRMETKSYGDYK